jgi:hypothetical protein
VVGELQSGDGTPEVHNCRLVARLSRSAVKPLNRRRVPLGNPIPPLLEGLGQQTVLNREGRHNCHTSQPFIGAGPRSGSQNPVEFTVQGLEQRRIGWQRIGWQRIG